jgi:deoxyadenosine/deoxycytidine kinase
MADRKTYIAIEGVIGGGKTTLARMFAERLSARLVLEEAESNPFLLDFYRNRERYAFPTQLSFLVQRYRQQQVISQQDMFRRVTVADYLFEKDKIFASVNLNEKEMALYNKIAEVFSGGLPQPDLVIYLIARMDVLLKRIEARGRQYERHFDRAYLQALMAAYNDFFFHYTEAPVLAIDVGDTDFREDNGSFNAILKLADRHEGGTLYYKCVGEG